MMLVGLGLAALVLGGCLSQPGPECPETGCPERPTDLPLPQTRATGIQFLNCTQLIVPLQVPRALVEPLLP
ncbi:MAG: hypothetical protein ACRDKW_00020, partial [Actinomycetota bacterium]